MIHLKTRGMCLDIIDREEAKLKGLKKFFTGTACVRGHVSEWYVTGPGCIECARLSRRGLLPPAKIYGMGFNSGKRGTGYIARTKNGVLREYDHWRGMLRRSYDPEWKSIHQTYEKCEVDPDWLDYQNFARDYHNCKYKPENSDLDKDLLVLGNKTYRNELCVYLPEDINKSIVIRGTVSKWHARDEIFEYSCNGIYLGRSQSPTDLGEVWVSSKIERIRLLADAYKDVISPQAYKALLEIKIDFDDDGVVSRVK